MVYVDDMFMQAKVGRVSSRWCHLTADATDELHAFAARIGMRRSWFQPGSRDHYDVTEGMRRRAVLAGAVEVRWGREPWRLREEA
jgi:hypothetical protein